MAVVEVVNALDAEALAERGIYTFDTFQQVVAAQPVWLVEGLLMDKSVNVFVGDSGLGKTPWGVMLGISVAAGVPFLGRKVRKGPVLYCDAESTKHDFNRLVGTISTTLGLKSPPKDFYFWSPYWKEGASDTPISVELMDHVRQAKPQLVFVDPLRTFWPQADQKPEVVVAMINAMRKTGASWLITHHKRKQAQGQYVVAQSLAADPHGWFQDAAGTHSLINHSDTRLGAEKVTSGDAELVVGGFIRSFGPISPLYLAREYDDAGTPQGYQSVLGTGFLNEKDREVYNNLPEQFRYSDVKKALGATSDSNTKRLLAKFESLEIAKPNGNGYVKTRPRGVGGEVIVKAGGHGMNVLH